VEAVIEILERPAEISWDYDEEADVLYLSVGEPKPALGVDKLDHNDQVDEN
jgi:uncharacterized protein YuzE